MKQEVSVVNERLFDKCWAIYSSHNKDAEDMVANIDFLNYAAIVASEVLWGGLKIF